MHQLENSNNTLGWKQGLVYQKGEIGRIGSKLPFSSCLLILALGWSINLDKLKLTWNIEKK
jgi:hypothetical protein